MKDKAIVICLHGDETFGLGVIHKILKKIPIFIGNPEAVRKKVRYIDTDLNRAFPGNKNGNYEERRAFYLLNKLKKFKYVIDIHSSSSDTELFGIITKTNKYNIELAKKLGISKLVIMSKKIGKGMSLIDHHKCAISLEIGPHEKKENVYEVVKAINNFHNSVNSKEIKKNNKMKIFRIFNIISGENNAQFFIKNFKKVKKGDLIAKGKQKYYAKFDFVPVFVGEKAYKNVLCLATKEVKLI